jgi:hypothetical protein
MDTQRRVLHSSRRKSPLVIPLLLASLLAPSWARAQQKDKDAAALELAKQAIGTDYLGTNFAAAEQKLKKALQLCGASSCSPAVVARIHGYLGLVYVVGLGKGEEGKASFVLALQADPTLALDADLSTPEVEAAFGDAKKTIGGAPLPAAPETPPPSTVPAPPASEGTLVHTPPAEQAIRTPIPIYAELPEGVSGVTRVEVFYRPLGGEWKSLPMRRLKKGYGELIPCLDVGGVTGDLKYFIRALDAEGQVVGASGTRSAPLVVPIRNVLQGEPPYLPGSPPPAQCADAADCPPGLPGCPEAKSPDKGPSGAAPAATTSNWVTLSIQQDFLFVGSAMGACGSESDYVCFSGDEYYYGIPYSEQGGEISGGGLAATTRILAGYDRVITGGLALGVSVGVALRGGPLTPGGDSFLPIHAEGRVAYWFGGFAPRTGPRFFLAASGGVAQVDAKVRVVSYLDENDFMADKRTEHDAWRKTGTGFASLGGGALWALTPSSGILGELRVMQMFGASGTVLAPQLGYALGF